MNASLLVGKNKNKMKIFGTYDLRYLETGSADFDFIWSKNFWKSNCASPGLLMGEAVPLPVAAFDVSDLDDNG